MKPEFLLLIPLLLLGVLWQVTPLIARQGIFFGATVDPGFRRSDDGRRLLLSYRLQMALWTAMAIVISLLLSVPKPALAMLASTLLLIVGGLFSYWLKFREVHEHFGQRGPESAALSFCRNHSSSLSACGFVFRPSSGSLWWRSICRFTGTRYRRAFPCIGELTDNRTAGLREAFRASTVPYCWLHS